MRNSGRREAAAQAEADRLRARIEELSADLARSEEQVTRLAIAREEVARVLEEPAADPAVGRGEAEPQADGLPGHRLRRRARPAMGPGRSRGSSHLQGGDRQQRMAAAARLAWWV